MDVSLAVERILETENLTDYLEDADAQWLLDWGISQVRALLDGVDDEAVGDEITHRLMRVMRKLNQVAAHCGDMPLDELVEDLRDFRERYAAAFGAVRALGDEAEREAQLQAAADMLAHMTPRQALIYLVNVAQPTASDSDFST